MDDGSGNDPYIAYDSASFALTTITTITGLVTGSSYTATVRAVNVIGESEDSNELILHAGMVPSKI